MDYIKGKTLAEWRVTVKPSARQIVCVVSEIAAALTIVHSQNIVHGDLKPSNILIRDDGRITLCDFGLSRYVTDPDDTPRGGTAGFLAPEQISDAFGAISPLTDVYGLGGLFFAMLTGHPPMKGRDLPEIMANVLSPSLPEAPTRQGDVFSKELDTLILRCLEKDPHRRFPSMRDLLMGLANLMDQ